MSVWTVSFVSNHREYRSLYVIDEWTLECEYIYSFIGIVAAAAAASATAKTIDPLREGE